jgi:2-keto-4-pentenoate hydratase/2-oxohepta-3-ene-1,7-dioic acid hydratase in catechol pathway
MKLCRFDLVSSPGTPRTGIDGSNPVGVHEWTDVRLLAPVGLPSSVRLYPSLPTFAFRYLNSGSLVGPHGSVLPGEGSKLSCLPCLAVVVAGGGSVVPVSEADGLVLGLSAANVFFQNTGEKGGLMDQPSWTLDAGVAIGPSLTTPDELDDAVLEEADGRRYQIDFSLQVDGEEQGKGSTADLAVTIAEVFGQASLSTRLRQGDLFLLAIPGFSAILDFKSGSQVRLVSERLGTLVTKIT